MKTKTNKLGKPLLSYTVNFMRCDDGTEITVRSPVTVHKKKSRKPKR